MKQTGIVSHPLGKDSQETLNFYWYLLSLEKTDDIHCEISEEGRLRHSRPLSIEIPKEGLRIGPHLSVHSSIDVEWLSSDDERYLGSARTSEIKESNLILQFFAPSMSPCDLRKLASAYWRCLQLQTLPDFSGPGLTVRGVWKSGSPEVHWESILDDIKPHVSNHFESKITVEMLRHAEELRGPLMKLFKLSGRDGHRVQKGINTWTNAIENFLALGSVDDRNHQCVRAIEAFLPYKCFGREDFEKHLKRLLGWTKPEHLKLLGYMHRFRSKTEHMDDWMTVFDQVEQKLTPIQRTQLALRCALLSELIAARLIQRFLTRFNELSSTYVDSAAIDALFTTPDSDRLEKLWNTADPMVDFNADLSAKIESIIERMMTDHGEL